MPFLEATAGMPEATKRRVLRKMLTTAATVAALLLILGGLLTRLLHFSPGALGIASGIILLFIAVSMVFGRRPAAAITRSKARTRCRSRSSRWPCPTCSTRPGSSSWSPCRPRAESIAVLAVAVGVLVVVLVLDVVVFRWAVQVSSKLDASRMLVTEKVFGFLLAALGVQLILNGLSDVGVIHLAAAH